MIREQLGRHAVSSRVVTGLALITAAYVLVGCASSGAPGPKSRSGGTLGRTAGSSPHTGVAGGALPGTSSTYPAAPANLVQDYSLNGQTLMDQPTLTNAQLILPTGTLRLTADGLLPTAQVTTAGAEGSTDKAPAPGQEFERSRGLSTPPNLTQITSAQTRRRVTYQRCSLRW